MAFSVLCECGKTTEVRQAMAGVAMQCPHCGDRLQVPPLGVLREYAERDQPAPAVSDSQPTERARTRRRPAEIPDSLFIHYCGEVGFQGRISSSALENYAEIIVSKLDQRLEEIGENAALEIMLSCALIPDAAPIILLETTPPNRFTELIGRFKSDIEIVATPTVIDGPVAFIVYRRLNLGKVDTLGLIPFSTYQRSIQKKGIDCALMQSAARDQVRLSPSKRKVASWLNRVRETIFGPKKHRPPSERDQPGSPVQVDAEQHSAYGASKNRVETVEQYFGETSLEVLEELTSKEPLNADLWIAKASKYAADQNWEEAIQSCDVAIKLQPDCVPLYARRADAEMERDNLQAALRDWNRAIELAPQDPWFYFRRSQIFAALEANEQLEADLGRACELAPREPMFLLTRARHQMNRGEVAPAKRDLLRVLELDPNSGRAHEYLGWILSQTDLAELPAAVDHLTRAIELMPNVISARIHRSLAYATQNKFELALLDCAFVIDEAPDLGSGYGTKGRILQMRGDFNEAIECCTTAIEKGMESPIVLLARGFSYAATEQEELALLDCAAALALEPDNPLACQLQGMLSIQRGELETAMEALMKARDAAPDWSEPREQIALLHRMNENPEAAIEEQSVLIRRNPRHAGHHVNRAFAYTQSGEFEKSKNDYDKACELDPENDQIYYLRGCYLMDRQEDESAVEDFSRVLEIAPDNDDARFRRASLLLRLKRQSDALADYEKLIARHPEDPNAYTGRAYAHQLAGNEKAAEADLDRLREIVPEYSEQAIVHSCCAKVNWLQQQERYDEAIEVANELIDLVPDDSTGYQMRGWIYWYSEQFVEACEDYSHLLERDPEDAGILNSRGQVRAEMGEFDSALEDLEASLSISRQKGHKQLIAYALNGRALALAGLGRHDESEASYDESIQLCPQNAWAHYNRGIVLHQLGKVEQSAECFRSALDSKDPPLSERKRMRATAILEKNTSQ